MLIVLEDRRFVAQVAKCRSEGTQLSFFKLWWVQAVQAFGLRVLGLCDGLVFS